MPKQRYQSARQLKRQANILYMTRKLASEVGYDGLTMRGLAEKAEVSPKTLYNLFSSKDELLAAALEDLVGIIHETMDVHSGLQGFEHLLKVRQTSCDAIMRSPGFANVIVTLFFKARPGDRLVSALLGGNEQDTLEHLEYEKAQGSIHKELDLDKLSHHVSALMWGDMLLWDKGVISLDQLWNESHRSLLITFVGITMGKKRKELEQQLLSLGNANNKSSA
ncbi:MAG: TetR/AcrR family transcriptional regulator [Gammaproteobacteria bacterium]|jgi:AcrR family transcriptional regulator|nr:TetR/AcrR family transcriptional regulator [Gammaproteobacteria bacterium]MBT4494124.1 TetR/AcrR family transcriptional regulator [Gammaproteobacteria bacterium]MBT7371076.1 TetR/AcrR family transcriptional regulator [Gammaproteobacteria bacterium]